MKKREIQIVFRWNTADNQSGFCKGMISDLSDEKTDDEILSDIESGAIWDYLQPHPEFDLVSEKGDATITVTALKNGKEIAKSTRGIHVNQVNPENRRKNHGKRQGKSGKEKKKNGR